MSNFVRALFNEMILLTNLKNRYELMSPCSNDGPESRFAASQEVMLLQVFASGVRIVDLEFDLLPLLEAVVHHKL